MSAPIHLPKWFSPYFLGYGDPKNLLKAPQDFTVDFNDTFLSFEHVIESFPDYKVEQGATERTEAPEKTKKVKRKEKSPAETSCLPPYQLCFNEDEKKITVTSITRKHSTDTLMDKLQNSVPALSTKKAKIEPEEKLEKSKEAEEPPIQLTYGKYRKIVKKNQIKFTDTQISAIKSAMRTESLTLVVGPPGTGMILLYAPFFVLILSSLFYHSESFFFIQQGKLILQCRFSLIGIINPEGKEHFF